MTPSRLRRPQFALIRSACEAYGLDIVEGVGYEADDVLASLALEVRVTVDVTVDFRAAVSTGESLYNQ